MLGVAVRLRSHLIGVYLLRVGGLLSTTLGVIIRLQSPWIIVCLLCVRTLLALLLSHSPSWKLTNCFSLYIGRHFPPFFFGFAFRIMCPPSSKFMTWVFELQIFKLWTLLTNVHIIIDNTFLNSLRSTTWGFDLNSNELIGMYLGLIHRRSCMALPNLGPGPLYCAELFWGRGLLLEIFLSSSSSWSIKLCAVDMSRPEAASCVVFLRGNRARIIVRSYFTPGQICLFLGNLHQVWLGPWLHIYRPVRMAFLR